VRAEAQSGRQMCGLRAAREFMLDQHFPRPPDDFVRQSDELAHFDSYCGRRAGLDFAQDAMPTPVSSPKRENFLDLPPVALQQVGKLEIVSREERLSPYARGAETQPRPMQSQAVVGRGAADRPRREESGIAPWRCAGLPRLRHLYHESRTSARQIVACTNAVKTRSISKRRTDRAGRTIHLAPE